MNYSKIKFEKSKAQNGNSNAPLSYTYLDTEISEKEVFYKLNQMDINGENKMYNPVSVKPAFINSGVKIYTNPATNTL